MSRSESILSVKSVLTKSSSFPGHDYLHGQAISVKNVLTSPPPISPRLSKPSPKTLMQLQAQISLSPSLKNTSKLRNLPHRYCENLLKKSSFTKKCEQTNHSSIQEVDHANRLSNRLIFIAILWVCLGDVNTSSNAIGNHNHRLSINGQSNG